MTAMEMYLLASLFIAFCQFLYNFFAGINTFNQTGNITYCIDSFIQISLQHAIVKASRIRIIISLLIFL